MLRGLSTVRYHTSDLAAAKHWYSEFLGLEPYFERPGYIEFRLGDYQHELGLLDNQYRSSLEAHDHENANPAGVVLYWHVDDVNSTLERLVSLGAQVVEPVRHFGNGFIGAAVLDPFGNILGIMHNPHYLEMVGTHQTRVA